LSARLRAPPSAPLRPGHAAQDTWADFARWCRTHQVRTSVGRTGVCWDSAAAESFFATLKNEMYYRHTWPPRTRARFAVASTSRCSTTSTVAVVAQGVRGHRDMLDARNLTSWLGERLVKPVFRRFA
jgi:transposase InsO family protein